jgi:hypothetical protein
MIQIGMCAEESCSHCDTNKPTKAKMYVGLNFEIPKVTFTSVCIHGPLEQQTAKEIESSVLVISIGEGSESKSIDRVSFEYFRLEKIQKLCFCSSHTKINSPFFSVLNSEFFIPLKNINIS